MNKNVVPANDNGSQMHNVPVSQQIDNYMRGNGQVQEQVRPNPPPKPKSNINVNNPLLNMI